MIWGKTFVRWLWHVTSAFASVHNDDPDNNCHRNHSFALSSNVARKISLKCHRSTVQSLPWSIWNVCCFRYPNPPGLRMELRSLLIVITAVIQSQRQLWRGVTKFHCIYPSIHRALGVRSSVDSQKLTLQTVTDGQTRWLTKAKAVVTVAGGLPKQSHCYLSNVINGCVD